jgi:oligoribonuclease NrnB/cAMP/cGMP phosphodiesterase (DHH superfamily)
VKHTCFYHAGCPDGFGAAWAVRRAWGREARFVAQGHEDRLNAAAHEGERVVFVDIAPDNALLRKLGQVAAQVTVLDHHLSARDRYTADLGLANALEAEGHVIHFDLSHSGAVLAWQYFHPGEAAPNLLLYVEDQDLWNWKLPRSEEINAAIGSYPREFEVWEDLAARPIESLAQEGAPIVRSNRIEVQRILVAAHRVQLGERVAEAVNSPILRSAVGHELAKREQFGSPVGLVYRLTGSRVDVSIYSVGDLDVSKIAAGYGGGGHRNAAGFSIPLESWLRDFI